MNLRYIPEYTGVVPLSASTSSLSLSLSSLKKEAKGTALDHRHRVVTGTIDRKVDTSKFELFNKKEQQLFSSSPLVSGLVLPTTNENTIITEQGTASDNKSLVVDSKKGKNKKKSKRWTKPIGKPKRPLSAYNIFFAEERKRMLGNDIPTPEQEALKKKVHCKTHGKVSFTAMGRTIGAKWKSLSPENRKFYEDKARIFKVKYLNELDGWKKQRREQEQRQQHQQQSSSPSSPAPHATNENQDKPMVSCDKWKERQIEERLSSSKFLSTSHIGGVDLIAAARYLDPVAPQLRPEMLLSNPDVDARKKKAQYMVEWNRWDLHQKNRNHSATNGSNNNSMGGKVANATSRSAHATSSSFGQAGPPVPCAFSPSKFVSPTPLSSLSLDNTMNANTTNRNHALSSLLTKQIMLEREEKNQRQQFLSSLLSFISKSNISQLSDYELNLLLAYTQSPSTDDLSQINYPTLSQNESLVQQQQQQCNYGFCPLQVRESLKVSSSSGLGRNDPKVKADLHSRGFQQEEQDQNVRPPSFFNSRDNNKQYLQELDEYSIILKRLRQQGLYDKK